MFYVLCYAANKEEPLITYMIHANSKHKFLINIINIQGVQKMFMEIILYSLFIKMITN